MKLRNVLVSVLCLILVLGMAACTATPAATTTTAAETTTAAAAESTRTKIVWGTNAAFIPFEMRENDKVIGVDADLAKAVADKIKEWHPDMEVKIASAQGLADCKKLLMLAKGMMTLEKFIEMENA